MFWSSIICPNLTSCISARYELRSTVSAYLISFFHLNADLNMDDKTAIKAKGLWEDWHMRQSIEQANRINQRSGTLIHKIFYQG